MNSSYNHVLVPFAQKAESMPEPELELFTDLERHLPLSRELYTRLHREPRLSGHEAPTLRSVLANMPVNAQVQMLPGNAGLVRIGPPGPAVAIRAEMDALPIVERTGVPWASGNGAMHACGHDVHMAALVAVARTLSTRADLPAPMVGLLQPREETHPSGALDFINGGFLEAHQVAAVIGAHVQPALDSTMIACNPGVVNAASDEFVITMHGCAAHGAYPHTARDPLLAAASFVVTCQQIVSRNADPTDSAVVSIGSIGGGNAPNAIPGEAIVGGTIRSTSAQQRDMIRQRISEVADGIAAAHGCTAEVVIHPGEPSLVNDSALAHGTATLLRASGQQLCDFRSYGADDFAYYTAVAPTLMIFVGTPETEGQGLHTDTYLPDSDALRRVAHSMLAGYLAACRAIIDNPSPATLELGATSGSLRASSTVVTRTLDI